MKVKIISIVLLVALLAPSVSAYARSTEDVFKEIDEDYAEMEAKEQAQKMPATMTNYAVMAIAALVIIAGGVYLGLKMYHKNHPPADNSDKK